MAKVAAAASKAHDEQLELDTGGQESSEETLGGDNPAQLQDNNASKAGFNLNKASKGDNNKGVAVQVASVEQQAEVPEQVAAEKPESKKVERGSRGQARAAVTSGTVTPSSQAAVMTIQSAGAAKAISLEQLGAGAPTWEKKIETDTDSGGREPRRHAAVTG